MNKKEMKKKLEKERLGMRQIENNSLNNSVRNGIIISVCVIAFLLLMFVFTKIKTGEWDLFTKKNNYKYTAEIQSEKISCGSILNRDEKDYYVLAYDMSKDDVTLYESMLERYKQSPRSMKIYKLDLGNSRNSICIGDTLNITNDITNLKLTVPTLLKIKDGNIVLTLNQYNQIKEELYKNVD